MMQKNKNNEKKVAEWRTPKKYFFLICCRKNYYKWHFNDILSATNVSPDLVFEEECSA
jgi:hypothetical protein